MSFKWRDNSIRIMAVLIALLLWIYVTNEQNPVTDQTFAIPLTQSDEPEGYVFKGVPNTVNVRVKGARSVVGTLSRYDFSAQVSLLGITTGQQEVPVQVSAPPGVEVLQVIPQVIQVQADKVTQKSVPVVVNLKGSVDAGLQLGQPVLKPPVVSVRGPSKTLEQIRQVGVVLDVAGMTDTMEREVRVETGVQGVTTIPSRVVVTVPITSLPTKNLPVRVRITGEPAAGYKLDGITSSPSTLQITGPQNVLEGSTAVSTMTVDVTGITDDVEREVPLILPDGVNSINPEQVQIKVRIVPEENNPPPPETGEDGAANPNGG